MIDVLFPINSIHVKAKIWEKDTPNLFDFETEQIIKKDFILKEKGRT